MARYEPYDIHAIFDELDKANDRAAVIVGTALLEHALQEAISSELPSDSKAESTFWEKISKAHSLKIIGPITRHDFDLIRKIRNECAHNMNPVKFTDPFIAEHFNKMKRINSLHIDDTDAIRAKFIRLIQLYTGSLMLQSQLTVDVIRTLNTDEALFKFTSNDEDAVPFLTLTLE